VASSPRSTSKRGNIRTISLSRWRERAGVRVEGGYDLRFSPSLPLCGIPYSPIYAKRCGTASSPQRGEEIERFYSLNNSYTKQARKTRQTPALIGIKLDPVFSWDERMT